MPNPVARLVTTTYPDGDVRSVWTWCPGCDRLHPFSLAPSKGVFWEWDGNLEQPTFSPSMLVHSSVHLCEGEHDPILCEGSCDLPNHALGVVIDGTPTWRFPDGMPDEYTAIRGHGQPCTREPAWGNCHSFLRAGRWEFLSDSAHSLAGQTVDMVPLPDGWAGR